MLIHIIRHTTPDIAKGICYGQADIGLASTFEQERGAVLANLLPEYDALYTSPLQRCSRLAESIKATESIVSKAIMEYNFGDWELTSWEQLHNLDSAAWFADYINVAAPNGESFKDMQKRVTQFIENVIQQNHQSVAIVTHSGVQRLVWAWLLEIPLDKIFQLDIAYGTVFELNYNKENKLGKIKQL